MKIYDFDIQSKDNVLRAIGDIRMRTNNGGSGLFIGADNRQILHNGFYPSKREIRQYARAEIMASWSRITGELEDDCPFFRLVLTNQITL